MKIIFATHNLGKLKEMHALLQGLNVDLLSSVEAGVREEPIEDGATFKENALKKARFVAEQTGEWALSDDSGLCIDVLDGAPGVLSARWAGEKATDEEIIRYTLAELSAISLERRQAYFESALALVAPDGRHWTFMGKIQGQITDAPRGTPRPKLPYDLIFIPKGRDKTFAEMSDTEKNSLSHRGIAFRQLRDFLEGEYT